MKKNVKLWEEYNMDIDPDDDYMPAGKYWIGDLCYVMHDKWDSFCNTTIVGDDVIDGKITLDDGTTVVSLTTAYGDGIYKDQKGHEYPVDAGLIGAIPVDSITDPNANLSNGRIVNFMTDWNFYKNYQGLLTFGNVEINTGDEEEDDDYYDNYYDDEDDEYFDY